MVYHRPSQITRMLKDAKINNITPSKLDLIILSLPNNTMNTQTQTHNNNNNNNNIMSPTSTNSKNSKVFQFPITPTQTSPSTDLTSSSSRLRSLKASNSNSPINSNLSAIYGFEKFQIILKTLETNHHIKGKFL